MAYTRQSRGAGTGWFRRRCGRT